MPSTGPETSLRVINDESKFPKNDDHTRKEKTDFPVKSEESSNSPMDSHHDARKNRVINESFEEAPLWAAIITYFGYLVLNIFGWFRDFNRYMGFEEKKV